MSDNINLRVESVWEKLQIEQHKNGRRNLRLFYGLFGDDGPECIIDHTEESDKLEYIFVPWDLRCRFNGHRNLCGIAFLVPESIAEAISVRIKANELDIAYKLLIERNISRAVFTGIEKDDL